ncbi:Prokaryotic membrane lipoprotein lipid attachment site profile [Propionibacterium ruminifibrarum]|uniref:Prokaryotic membrane lipoprotein lipid attachment site profile n=1 Tax=Propionibacterium ruminifibrarum TaxID=1962131 RepID=A0A375I6Z7_9ACTN|nr:hypothetical protein [Propionibacterium ruminifibrarum]SPF69297.1 Prokaryotic membrane lipoprotein lipid attachment site profile [Propionibacterium ruminifibrarum]
MSIGTKTAAAATALIAAASLVGCSGSSSSGEDSSASASTGTYSSVEECTGAGQVWLVVSTDQGEVLANQCVGNPENGAAALEAAGLTIARDGNSQFICQIDGYPSECTVTSDSYWNYYHAEPAGTWFYSQESADTFAPEGGWIEGWCYGTTCTPEGIEGDAAPQIDTSGPAAGDADETAAADDQDQSPEAEQSSAA